MRRADVFLFERLAGRIVETDDGQCQFAYDADYMKDPAYRRNFHCILKRQRTPSIV